MFGNGLLITRNYMLFLASLSQTRIIYLKNIYISVNDEILFFYNKRIIEDFLKIIHSCNIQQQFAIFAITHSEQIIMHVFHMLKKFPGERDEIYCAINV